MKSIADGGDAWEYVNPDLAEEPVVPRRPAGPTARDVNPQKASIVELDDAEKETYKLLMVEHRENSAVTKQVLDAIQTVRNYILTTVSSRNIVYIKDKSTVFQMLVALKKRLAPTDYARKLEVVHKYNKLKTYSKRENIEK